MRYFHEILFTVNWTKIHFCLLFSSSINPSLRYQSILNDSNFVFVFVLLRTHHDDYCLIQSAIGLYLGICLEINWRQKNQSTMLTLWNITRWLQTNAVIHLFVYLFVNVPTAADACLLIDGIPVFCVIKISSLSSLRRCQYEFKSHSIECMFVYHNLCCIRVCLVWLMGCG